MKKNRLVLNYVFPIAALSFVLSLSFMGTNKSVFVKADNTNYDAWVYPDRGYILIEPNGTPVEVTKKTANFDFVPDTLDTSIYNRVITANEEQAYEGARLMGKKEGMLVGISSGAALYVGLSLAKLPEYKNKNIVIICPDGGDRYLSTPLFGEE